MEREVAVKISRLVLLSGLLSSFLAPVAAQAEGMSDGVIKIGVINDQSGSLADLSGVGSVIAAQLAIDEFNGAVNGVKVELVSADHQNKADIGSAIVRRWFTSEQVDAVADISNSSVGLATVGLAVENNKVVLNTSGSSDFTGKACSAVSFQWAYSTYTNAAALTKAILSRSPKDWYLVTVDYAFGHQLSADVRRIVEGGGGQITGETRFPINTPDFASVLIPAQRSKAEVVVLSSSGADTTNFVKQAAEFGLTRNQTLATPTVWITEVDAMGLDVAQGLTFAVPFYWDLNDGTREWSKRFHERAGKMPTMQHAGTYSAVLHYLKAIQAANTDDTETVVAKMRELPVEDNAFGSGWVRADGAMIHDFNLVRVKTPAESTGRWDYYEVLEHIKAEDVYPKLEDQSCSLIK